MGVLILVLVFAQLSFATSGFDFKIPDQFICETSITQTAVALATSRQHRRQLQGFAIDSLQESITTDHGHIAVLEDDGTVITQPNLLDLASRSIQFTPAGGDSYVVISQTGSFDTGTGSPVTAVLGDDDSTLISLPFPFVFYGVSYTSVHLNSDGNLTFNEPDTASIDRNLRRIVVGPPRISPLFDDLNPAVSGLVTIDKLPDRVVFTWTDVGEWTSGGTGSIGQNTFQAVLNSGGIIRFNYQNLDAMQAVAGIAPGRAADTPISLIDLSLQLTPSSPLAGVIAEVFATIQEMDLSRVAEIFYRTHPDSYDGLAVFADFSISLGGAFAYALPIRNSVGGIINTHNSQYDYGLAYGSPQRLSVVMNMGTLSRYGVNPYAQILGTNTALDILSHEFGHRWLAFTDLGSPSLLGRDRSHWSFLYNTFGSVMEGNEIEDLGNGQFRTVGATARYSPLDQYIMGLRPGSEVPPSFVVANPVLPATLPLGFPSSCRDPQLLPGCAPFIGLQFSGSRHDVTMDDFFSFLGPRNPSFELAPRDFRVAFILITQRTQAPRLSSLETLETLRTQWPLFFSQAVDGRAIMNTDLLHFPPPMEPALTEFHASLTVNGSRQVETDGTRAPIQVGYATLESALGVAVIQSYAGSDLRSEAAVPPATIGTSFLVYAERTERTSTGLAIVNTTSSAASITAVLSNGLQTTLQLAPRHQISQFLHELFPQVGTAFTGSLSLVSDAPIGLVALRGTTNNRGDFIITSVPVSTGSTTPANLIFPQIADGQGYVTEIVLLNPAAVGISGSIEFSFSISTDQGTGTRFPYEIAAGGVWKLQTAGIGADIRTGHGTIEPDGGNAAPVSTAILKQFAGTDLNFEAGVPANGTLRRGMMFGVRNSTHRSVVAVTGSGGIQLTPYRADGSAAAAATTITLSAGGRLAAFLDELIPDLPVDFEGTVLMEASSPVSVITLRTTINALGAFLMTAMPVLDLERVSSAEVSYFPQLADGGGFTTEFLLLSPAAVTTTLRFFRPDGQPLAIPIRF